MPSPATSRHNLARYWNRVGRPRSGDESALNWRLTLQWWTRDQRSPRTQREWAEQLGVSQPYIAKMVRRFKREWLDLAGRWPGWQEDTLDDLQHATERRKRARALLDDERLWEQYDAEQRRRDHHASDEYRNEYGDVYYVDGSYVRDDDAEQEPASHDAGREPHPDPQLRGLVWVPRRRR